MFELEELASPFQPPSMRKQTLRKSGILVFSFSLPPQLLNPREMMQLLPKLLREGLCPGFGIAGPHGLGYILVKIQLTQTLRTIQEWISVTKERWRYRGQAQLLETHLFPIFSTCTCIMRTPNISPVNRFTPGGNSTKAVNHDAIRVTPASDNRDQVQPS